MKMSEAERRAFERFMMNKASERGMLESAKIEGQIEERIETARVMLAKGEPLEKIKLYARLTEQEILALQSET